MTCASCNDRNDTRQLARKLFMHPPPVLSNGDVQRRWHCSRATVDRYRKRHGLKSVSNEGHPAFSLIDLLEGEGVADPLAVWALGTDEEREVLAAPLLSIEDLELLENRLRSHHPETYRSRAREGRGRHGIKIGHRWLFRPTIREIERIEVQLTHPAKGG